jgi:hypothetical protein
MHVRCRLLLSLFSIGCASTVSGSTGSSDAGSAETGAPEASPIVATDIARACLLAVGCGAAPVGSVGACVRSLTRRALAPEVTGEDLWDRLLECASRPSARATCDAFVDCTTRGHPESYCAAHPGETCDGHVAVHCGDAGAPATADDCNATPGASCAVFSTGVTRASCQGPCGCTDGNAVVHCSGIPGQYVERCTAGTSCVSGTFFTSPIGSCAPAGPACTQGGAARCEGSTLVRCVGYLTVLRETRADCARLGWQCVTGDDGAACVPPPFACALDAAPTCEGDTLVACAAGADPRFDCRALGFARCAPATKSVAARCEP